MKNVCFLLKICHDSFVYQYIAMNFAVLSIYLIRCGVQEVRRRVVPGSGGLVEVAHGRLSHSDQSRVRNQAGNLLLLLLLCGLLLVGRVGSGVARNIHVAALPQLAVNQEAEAGR